MRVNIGKDGKITLSDFSPVQAYKVAVKMEKDGIDFYEDLRKKVRDEEARLEIDFLIEQEKDHLKTFEGLLNREKETAGDEFEEDDIVNYMNAHVFDGSRAKKDAGEVEHRHTALEEAMNMERRSIVFYEGSLAQSKDAQAKKALGKILEEEKEHLERFAELLRVKCINSGRGCLL